MSIRITNNIDLSCKECKKLEQQNAQLRELIRLAIAGFEVVENKHKESFTYWLSEARKVLEKANE